MDNKRYVVSEVVDGHKFANAGATTWGDNSWLCCLNGVKINSFDLRSWGRKEREDWFGFQNQPCGVVGGTSSVTGGGVN